MNPTQRATLIGSTAVLMWSTLALLTKRSGNLPPFQLTAMAFAIAFGIGLAMWAWEGHPISHYVKLPWRVWLLGVGGLFGYHFFYFVALRHAPPTEASLIAYLWPLLIVVLAAALLRQPLRWFHWVGVGLGFLGMAVLVTGGRGLTIERQYWLGYGAALVCAAVWSLYSVLSRTVGDVPTGAVGGFCGVTAVLALLCHWLLEETVWPQGGQWLALVLLGLGPIGAAFFTWDIGVKRGNITLLGTLSYAAPLLSTLLLVLFGEGEATGALGLACVLVVGGAAVASQRR